MSEILVNSLKTAAGVDTLTFDSTGDVLLSTGRIGRVAGNTITIDSDGILNATSVNVSSTITLPAGSIDSAAIGTGAVSANKIASGAVDSDAIGTGAVGTAKLQDGAVTASQIADSSVGANELNVSGNGTAGQFLSSDGDGTFSWADAGGGGGGYTVIWEGSSTSVNIARSSLPEGWYIIQLSERPYNVKPAGFVYIPGGTGSFDKRVIASGAEVVWDMFGEGFVLFAQTYITGSTTLNFSMLNGIRWSRFGPSSTYGFSEESSFHSIERIILLSEPA